MLSFLSSYLSTLFTLMSSSDFAGCLLIVPFLFMLPFLVVGLFKLIWSAVWNMF